MEERGLQKEGIRREEVFKGERKREKEKGYMNGGEEKQGKRGE